MNSKERKEIINYLSGPRDHAEGARLYSRYGLNLRLKKMFAYEQNETTHSMMLDELRKIAGLSEIEYARLPRLSAEAMAIANNVVMVEEIDTKAAAGQIPQTAATVAPETMQKMIRFRDRYPFLKEEDCPDVLKVLVADMFAAYDNYKSAHARLMTLRDEDTEAAAKECEQIVEEYLKNREIWDELEYYKEHKSILGKASKFREMEKAVELSSLSDIELLGQLRSAQANVSKHKKALKEAKTPEEKEKYSASLARWEERRDILREETERRKKK